MQLFMSSWLNLKREFLVPMMLCRSSLSLHWSLFQHLVLGLGSLDQRMLLQLQSSIKVPHPPSLSALLLIISLLELETRPQWTALKSFKVLMCYILTYEIWKLNPLLLMIHMVWMGCTLGERGSHTSRLSSSGLASGMVL